MTSPAAAAPLFVVCYDISNDRERHRVDRLLTGYGHRSQKSVFECHLTAAAHRKLQEQVDRLGVKTGHVKLYRVYAGSANTVFGSPPEDPDAGFSYCI